MKLPDWLLPLPLLWLWLWLACASALASAAPIDISSPLLNHKVAPALDIREDPGGLLMLPDVLRTPTAFRPASRLNFPRCDCAI